MKLNEIVLRYLKGQKKHTVLTVLAIIVSVAFMTIILSAVSVYRAASLNISRETNGTYHIVFNGLDKQQLIDIRSMDIFEKTEIYSISSYSSSVDMDFVKMAEDNAKVEYLLVNGLPVDDNFLRLNADDCDLLPPSMRTVTGGRLPEKDGELVINSANAEQWGYPEIGSTVNAELFVCGVKTGAETPAGTPMILAENFDITEIRELSFTVVGYSDTINMVSYNDTQLKSYNYLSDNLVARFSDSANDFYWDMDRTFSALGYEIDDFDYGMNQELLNMEGRGVTARFSQALSFAVEYLVVLFFMFCIRMVIDNSFELASKERIKQFGLLKAVGASKKQVFSLVMWEAFYLAVPGVILGILAGLGSSAAIFSAVKNLPYLHDVSLDYDLASMLEFDIKPYVYISSAVIGFLWVFVSAISTGMRSIKASPVDAMRAAAKKEKIKPSRHGSGIEQGHGFIGAYSALSAKRNKKRYIITLISMVMSIVLFTVFSYGIEIATGNLQNEFDVKRMPYDYTANLSVTDPQTVYERAELMKQSGYFTDVQYDTHLSLFGMTSSAGVDDGTELSKSETVFIDIHPVNRETYEKYIQSDVSYNDLSNGQLMLCSGMYSTAGKLLYTVYSSAPESISAAPFVDYKVDLLDECSFDTAGIYTTDNRVYRSTDGRISAVMAEESYNELFAQCGADSGTSSMAVSDGSEIIVYSRTISANAAVGMEEQAEVYMNNHFYNSYSNNLSDMNLSYALLSMIKTAGYAVIVLIALIALINVVNIISSNVTGRTSELAMLRACGMSKKQLNKLMLTESLFYAVMAGIASLLITELAIFVIQIPFMTHFHDLDMDDLGFAFSYLAPIKYIVIATAVSYLAAAVSSVIPGSHIAKAPIVESIESAEI